MPSLDVANILPRGNIIRHPQCCLSLSVTLLDALTQTIRVCRVPPGTVLSIGCGSGLLEALWLAHLRTEPKGSGPFEIEGVEVQQSELDAPVNKHLSEPAINTVSSTNIVSSRLLDEDVFCVMFVYPRQPSLVHSYSTRIAKERQDLSVVIWLGLIVDWPAFKASFNPIFESQHQDIKLDIRYGAEVGLDPSEMMVNINLTPRSNCKPPNPP